MRKSFRQFRCSATGIVALFLVVSLNLLAQAPAESSQAQTLSADKKNYAELAESYRKLHEQLRTAEQAIANNRAEAEAAASARSAAITEKLDTLKFAMLAERERMQGEAQRSTYERMRQQTEAQAMTQNIFMGVVIFGSAGLLALVSIAFLQWRSSKRMAEFTTQLQQLPMSAQPGLLPLENSAPGSENVAQSNQRLNSMINRMEQRVLELEQTVTTPSPVASTGPGVLPKIVSSPANAADAQTARIAALLDQGRALLNMKRSAEAIACYDEVLNLDENHPEALMKKGSALERLRQNQEAMEYYDRAIEADRNQALAYISKGGLCVRMERFDEALVCYEQALQAGKNINPSGVTRVSVSADWPPTR